MALSNISKVEKNKLNTDSSFLCLLDITIPSVAETVRIVNNNEDITWNSENYQAFPFDIDEISESANAELSQFSIKVGNANNIVGQYVRQYEAYIKEFGFQAITCTLYVVNTKDLDNTEPIYSTNLILSSSNVTAIEVTFTVSARDLFRVRTPLHRMFPNSCRFAFKSTQCGYIGSENNCDKTLFSCQGYGNSDRYGGFPTITNEGVSI